METAALGVTGEVGEGLTELSRVTPAIPHAEQSVPDGVIPREPLFRRNEVSNLHNVMHGRALCPYFPCCYNPCRQETRPVKFFSVACYFSPRALPRARSVRRQAEGPLAET